MNLSNIPSRSSKNSRAIGIEPEFFRLPASGHDPHFGLTRSFYYAAEARGWIKLKRLRCPGKMRGITLISYQEIKEFLNRGNTQGE